jgi:hypothetical protein
MTKVTNNEIIIASKHKVVYEYRKLFGFVWWKELLATRVSPDLHIKSFDQQVGRVFINEKEYVPLSSPIEPDSKQV